MSGKVHYRPLVFCPRNHEALGFDDDPSKGWPDWGDRSDKADLDNWRQRCCNETEPLRLCEKKWLMIKALKLSTEVNIRRTREELYHEAVRKYNEEALIISQKHATEVCQFQKTIYIAIKMIQELSNRVNSSGGHFECHCGHISPTVTPFLLHKSQHPKEESFRPIYEYLCKYPDPEESIQSNAIQQNPASTLDLDFLGASSCEGAMFNTSNLAHDHQYPVPIEIDLNSAAPWEPFTLFGDEEVEAYFDSVFSGNPNHSLPDHQNIPELRDGFGQASRSVREATVSNKSSSSRFDTTSSQNGIPDMVLEASVWTPENAGMQEHHDIQDDEISLVSDVSYVPKNRRKRKRVRFVDPPTSATNSRSSSPDTHESSRGVVTDQQSPDPAEHVEERQTSEFDNDEKTTKKKHTCTHCGKTFTRSTTLRDHLRTHTNEKPFQCTTCGKYFSRTKDRTRHQALHTEPKKFLCQGKAGDTEWGCGRKFPREDGLVAHFRTEKGGKCIRPLMVVMDLRTNDEPFLLWDEGTKKYYCTKGSSSKNSFGGNMGCGESFVSKAALLAHWQSATGRFCARKFLVQAAIHYAQKYRSKTHQIEEEPEAEMEYTAAEVQLEGLSPNPSSEGVDEATDDT